MSAVNLSMREAGGGQRVDAHAARWLRAARTARAHARRSPPPRQPMSGRGCMAGAAADTIRSAACAGQVQRAAHGRVHGTGASVVRVTTASRGPSSCVDATAPRSGSPARLASRPRAGSLSVQRGLEPCGVGDAGHGIAARAIDLADVQAPAEIVRRGEFARTVQRNGSGGAGQCRADVQPRDAQLAQDDRRGQARAAGGRPDRHPDRLDARRLQPIDHDAPVQQLQRRPVEREVLDRGVVALRVAQFDAGDPQRVGEPPGRCRRGGPCRRSAAASASRAPAAPALCWRRAAAAPAAPPAPPVSQPIHFAARRIRTPARSRCTVRKRRRGACGSMAMRHRDELGRSRCNIARRRPRRRASCW